MYADITEGQSYTVDLILGDLSGGAYPTGAKVFIDWNLDGDFDDANEEVGLIVLTQSPSSHTINFTVPTLGFFGNTRMRVVAQYNTDATILSFEADLIMGRHKQSHKGRALKNKIINQW